MLVFFYTQNLFITNNCLLTIVGGSIECKTINLRLLILKKMEVQVLGNKEFDIIIDSFWNFITDHKLDYVNTDQPIIQYKNGVLSIDLNDLNSCNVLNKKYGFLDCLNHLKNQIQ